jgi:hypothetical protein
MGYALNKDLKISYWLDQEKVLALSQDHLDELESNTMKHIFAQIQKGFMCGELYFLHNDVEHCGWWKIEFHNKLLD